MTNFRAALSTIALAGALASPARAEEAAATEVKGVNPADILNKADLIVKAVNLPQGEAFTAVAKYDTKLGGGFGANVEFPFASYVNIGAADAFGVGDLFMRVRYVKPLAPGLIGLVSSELVVPTASKALLGTGKWQLNPGGGVVKLWSQRAFSAIIYKHSFSIAGKSNRADIDVNQIRGLQTFILNRGMYITIDGKHEWQTKGVNQDWTTAEFEVGKQFNAKLAASMRIGKTWGDRPNNGAIDINVRTFF